MHAAKGTGNARGRPQGLADKGSRVSKRHTEQAPAPMGQPTPCQQPEPRKRPVTSPRGRCDTTAPKLSPVPQISTESAPPLTSMATCRVLTQGIHAQCSGSPPTWMGKKIISLVFLTSPLTFSSIINVSNKPHQYRQCVSLSPTEIRGIFMSPY